MTLQQLYYAVEVYRSGSISQAAANLYIAQPNLSKAIHTLENELQHTIFNRTPKGIILTKFGEQFIYEATELLSRYVAFENKFKNDHCKANHFSISSTRSSEISCRIAKYLSKITAQGIQIHVRFCETTNATVIDDVSSGEADIGIIRINDNVSEYYYQLLRLRELSSIELQCYTYKLLFSNQHPLANVPAITKEMLEPYIEIIHADYDIPVYPYSDYSYSGAFERSPKSKENIVFIYDRATLFDMLSTIVGSYVWTYTTHQQVREAFHLVERICENQTVRGKDIIVYKKKISSELGLLISYLRDPETLE